MDKPHDHQDEREAEVEGEEGEASLHQNSNVEPIRHVGPVAEDHRQDLREGIPDKVKEAEAVLKEKPTPLHCMEVRRHSFLVKSTGVEPPPNLGEQHSTRVTQELGETHA